MRADIVVTGIVQGVGFRPFVYRTAVQNGLTGFVRNRGDAVVEVTVKGTRARIDQFLRHVQDKKPPLAQINDLHVTFTEDESDFSQFTILESRNAADLSGSVIPPDVAICDECCRELRNPADRRHGYFFITCVDCGPRYSIIEHLPYDRPNTTMSKFETCDRCKREYENPANRRFHAQTVACDACGPHVYLTSNDGNVLDAVDPIRGAGELIDEGNIVAVKGIGGFHVATATTKIAPIARLRRVKHRVQKPFAIMARSLDAVKGFAELGGEEATLLTSYIRPIVLLKKSPTYCLSEEIAPGLQNIGVMLPYTGLHYLLFDGSREPAFIMTSANPPDEPIVTSNEEALEKLARDVDYFLFHNRDIAHRCDDSVARINSGVSSLIRRSRGYAPAPLHMKSSVKTATLGVGAQMNAAVCVLAGSQAFISQHIGDVDKLETQRFHKKATGHLLRLTNMRVEVVACDLHPGFITTRYAEELGDQLNRDAIRVQHHHAHIASLMAETDTPEMVGVACDGVGYGSDGNVWGGEVLYSDGREFKRLGHLQEHPMPGGDRATRYPLRMAAAILSNDMDVETWLRTQTDRFPHQSIEVDALLKQLEQNPRVVTSSCGRVLDAASAVLGFCHERTYEGEPAMKLESAAIGGRDVLGLNPKIEGGIIDTSHLLSEVFRHMGKHSPQDLAFSVEEYVAKSLGLLAADEAERLGIKSVGFSGGVAYNEHITACMRLTVEDRGLRFIVHGVVPPGDGGVSLGQAFVASMLST